MKLLDAEPFFEGAPGDGLIIRKEQIIDPHMLERANEMRHYEGREGEFMEVADIPTLVVEVWERQGFHLMTDRNITAKDIIKRLHKEGLDHFITTKKRV